MGVGVSSVGDSSGGRCVISGDSSGGRRVISRDNSGDVTVRESLCIINGIRVLSVEISLMLDAPSMAINIDVPLVDLGGP